MRASLRWTAIAALSLTALTALAIADPLASGPEPQADRRPLIGDDGSYAGVGIGDSPRRVRQRFGRCPASDGATSPLAYDISEDVAPSSGTPGEIAKDKPARSLRCQLASFGTKEGEIFSVDIVDPAVETPRGIGRGDPLADARDAYPEARCEVYGVGTEYGTFPQCHGRLRGGPHVWFGGDPVRLISYSSEPFRCGGDCPSWP